MAHLTDPPNAGSPDRHWNAVYAEGDRDRSWWQDEPAESLEAIALVAPAHDAPILDVGGGSSQLAGSLLERGHTDVTVLDLSSVALELARRRLGGQGERVTWIVADVLSWTPPRRYALWHDRAVLHFFTDPKDRARYAERVRASVTEGGHAIIATFAPDGPDRCSGLPVQRSSAADIAELLGNDFRMVDARTRPHRTPAGAIQPFTWVVAQASNS